ncbi:MAG TPA: alpha/beta fold hydrolase [Casimicrobiaceae bacterium]|nr:alpha/beta fold hydrolase [Casimicrobiaceae bacterium]
MSGRHGIPSLPELKLVAIDASRAGLEGPRMSYMEMGAQHRDTVVLLHGIGSNSTGWRFVMPALAVDHRVIAWNAPGYYLSDSIAAESPSHQAYSDALAALLDALGVASADIVGSSFGSLVAASFASRFPDRVGRLVLLGTTRGQAWLPPDERARRLEMRAASIRDGGLALGETRWMNLVSSAASATTVTLVKEVLGATHARGMMQAARTSDATDVVELVPGIKARTLLAVGTEDRVNPPEISRAIASAMKDARLVELPGVGHLPKLEAPERTIELIREHLST